MRFIQSDTHDYARGTRARRLVRAIFTKPTFWLLSVALRLNPDAVIIANARLGMHGACVFIDNDDVAILQRVEIVAADTSLRIVK